MDRIKRRSFKIVCGHAVRRIFASCSLICILTIFLAIFQICAAASAATVATVDQLDGYSNSVLEKVVANWNPPAVKGPYQLRVQISLDDTGKAADCKVLKKSPYPALDAYACQKIRKESPFGTPPYGMPVETYFAIWSDGMGNMPKKQSLSNAETKDEVLTATTASVAKNARFRKYLNNATHKIRNSIYIPVEAKPGLYHVTARITCNSKGKIISSSIIKSSGDALLDKYVRQGIKRADSVGAPPAGLGNTFDLTFSLQRL